MGTAGPIIKLNWMATASAAPSAELEDEGDPMDLDEKNPEDILKHSTLILCSTRSYRLQEVAVANKRKFPTSLSDPFAAPRSLQPTWQHVEREPVEQTLRKRKGGNDGPDFHIEDVLQRRKRPKIKAQQPVVSDSVCAPRSLDWKKKVLDPDYAAKPQDEINR
jgi:hypothetical protein